jgi:hypothetical protein
MKLYLEAVCDRLENHACVRRERADAQFHDRLDEFAQEAKWSVEVVKEEGIEALGEARGAALHECEDELVTLAAAFEERLDKISSDVLRKAEDKAIKAEALLSAITLKLEAKAAALLLDVAAKARRDETACRSRRRPFIRGKGGYRGLGERYLLRSSS